MSGSDTPPGGTLFAARRRWGAGAVLRIGVVWQRGKKTMDVDVKIKLGDEMGRDNMRISLENETSGGKWWCVLCLWVV